LFTQAEEDAATGRRLKLCRGNIVQAIGNGVNSERFSSNSITEASRRALRSEQGATDKDVIILMVGRLVAEKGYCELLKAIESVDAHLWVIGSRLESDHASSIDNAIQKVRVDPALSARIKFLGYRDDVDKLMGAVDIFTLPSHREGMPRSIIEAMMSGLPVVATDIRGSREEVIHDTTGLLVPLKDSDQLAAALNQLVRNKSQRHQMGKAGKIRALDLYDENIVIDRQLHALGLK
jgi:glycosyltransferase involved in cell wall biosynthesis